MITEVPNNLCVSVRIELVEIRSSEPFDKLRVNGEVFNCGVVKNNVL
jgi:hypothetical protein